MKNDGINNKMNDPLDDLSYLDNSKKLVGILKDLKINYSSSLYKRALNKIFGYHKLNYLQKLIQVKVVENNFQSNG